MARQFRNRPTRSRPNRSWGGVATPAFVTIPAASKVLIGGFLANNAGIDETIMRVVGKMAVKTDQDAGTEFQIGALGMMVVTDAALAVGITAIPGPVTDINDDGWFLYVPIVQAIQVASSIGLDAQAGVGYDFNSRGRRIVELGSNVVIVVENIHATQGFLVAIVMRLLSQVRGTG